MNNGNVEINARIFLSGQRKVGQTSHYRVAQAVLKDFNGDSRIVINDFTLTKESSADHKSSIDSTILLIPLVGSVHIERNGEEEIQVGEALFLSCESNEVVTYRNPYKRNPISFLEIILPPVIKGSNRFALGLNQNLNSLQQITPVQPEDSSIEILIGKYKGRQHGNIAVKDTEEIISFVIGGAFEVANRLLHERDALWLTGVDQLEFEALTREGILLVVRRQSLK